MQKAFGTAKCHNVWLSGQSTALHDRLGEPGGRHVGTAGVCKGEGDAIIKVINYIYQRQHSVLHLFTNPLSPLSIWFQAVEHEVILGNILPSSKYKKKIYTKIYQKELLIVLFLCFMLETEGWNKQIFLLSCAIVLSFQGWVFLIHHQQCIKWLPLVRYIPFVL